MDERKERDFNMFVVPLRLSALLTFATTIIFDIMRCINPKRFVVIDVILGIENMGYPLVWVFASLLIIGLAYILSFYYQDNLSWVDHEEERCQKTGKKPRYNMNYLIYILIAIFFAIMFFVMRYSYWMAAVFIKILAAGVVTSTYIYEKKLK